MANPVDTVSVSQTIQKLQRKVTVVTGGASGIGEATTRKFALHGSRAMVITDVQDDKSQNVVASIGPDHSIYIHCDVTDEDQVKILVESTVKIYGRLDVIFSNAGIGSASKQTVMDPNLFPVYNSLTHSFCSHLQRDNDGSGRPLFTAKDAVNSVFERNADLFKLRFSGVFRRHRRFSGRSMEKALAELLTREDGKVLTLKDTCKPLLVPCYDMKSSAPFVFSRADASESASFDFELWKVCRATSSTPGLFKPLSS
ncbi:hypothetical protein ACFX13_019823 [Malus domestica]